MHFAQIEPAGNLYETVMIDEENEELYVQTHFLDAPENVPDELLINNGMYEEVYGIDSEEGYCSFGTRKYNIRYSYAKESFGLKFSDCTEMEYFSDTLVSFMCRYLDKEEDRDSVIDYSFRVEDVQIRFYGHRSYVSQQNPEYNRYDPTVIFTFPEEKTTADKIRYIHAVDDLLRLVFFQQKISRPHVKFTRTDLQEKEYIGFHICNRQRYVAEKSEGHKEWYSDYFEEIKGELPVIMAYLLNHEITAEYFKHYYQLESSQLQKLFSDTYFVFDKLANKAYGKVEEPNQEFEAFKEKIWKLAEESKEYEKVKDHLGNLKNKIMSHGRELGHKEKLRKAMEEISRLIPERDREYGFCNDETINRIYRLRTEIVHHGDLIRFDDVDRMALEKLQWLTYAMQLKQIGISDDRMEEWLNRTFGVG